LSFSNEELKLKSKGKKSEKPINEDKNKKELRRRNYNKKNDSNKSKGPDKKGSRRKLKMLRESEN
jgi:hypothetical protein